MDVQFSRYVFSMSKHGIYGDEKVVGYFLVRHPLYCACRISRSRSLITSRGCILSVSGAALVFTDFRTVLSSFLSVGTNKAFSSLQCVSRSFSQVYISKSTSFSKFTFSDGTLYFISRLFNSLSFNSIAECPRRNCSTGAKPSRAPRAGCLRM